MARSSGATGGAPKWTSEAIHLCMSVFRLPTHSRYAAWLSCGNGGTDDAEPSTPEKGPVANKKHLELGCGVPQVESLVRKMGGVPRIMEHFLCSWFVP